MKLTKSQQKDLETINYFNFDKGLYTEEDVESFFAYSERGIKPQIETRGYKTLLQGKRWRGIHMQMYEDGVLDGSMPYMVILGAYDKTVYRKWWQFWKPKYWFEHSPPPRSVVDFMKKEMFKGIDANTIEKCYCTLNNKTIYLSI